MTPRVLPKTYARPRASGAPVSRTGCTAPADAYLVRRGDGRTDRRRLSVVHRLGPRHVHRAARPVPRDRTARRRARDPARVGRRACREGMLPEPLPRSRRRRPSTTRSTPRSGSSSRSTSTARDAAARRSLVADERARCDDGGRTRSSTATRRGTRYGIRVDDDGLLAAGEPGVQLTWMDAKVGDWVDHAAHRQAGRDPGAVDQRARVAGALRRAALERASSARAGDASRARFWNDERRLPLRRRRRRPRRRARADATLRPNQIFAVGGLPLALLDGERARRVVDAVERELLTPLGLRTLAPGRAGLPRALRRRRPRARRRLPPGHRVAVARRPVRRGLAARARRHGRSPNRGAPPLRAAAARASRRAAASATSPRSPTATRRTRRAAARSRRGRLGELLRISSRSGRGLKKKKLDPEAATSRRP